LTSLDAGESWLVEPRQLDAAGQLWSPGVRAGVRPGSAFHTTEYFGPVLGIMHAATLEEALTWQNGTGYGLTAGLHSLDAAEVTTWLEGVEAGNLYVNRPITGAIVRRQPFGGWKRSAVGATAKAGGPNYLAQFGSWTPAPLSNRAAGTISPAVAELLDLLAPALDDQASTFLRSVAASDQRAWEREFGIAKDVTGLDAERNVFRYRPTAVTIRSEGGHVPLARVLLAARRSGAPVVVSTSAPLPAGINHVVETSEDWLRRVAEHRPARVRLVGASARPTAAAVEGDPDVTLFSGAVTSSGRVELLHFLLEQSVSISTHRYGLVDHSIDPFQ
jgi:RHH-type proline utilization regulon transcriptional repressor/proline dehydrogenase/delta 1-pyrroline-5-carboxylate dehydrogenase